MTHVAGYNDGECALSMALSALGERWALLIAREAFFGVNTFDDLHTNLGVGRKVLQNRLEELVAVGVLHKRQYQERPPRYEYLLTQSGTDLVPVLASLSEWGKQYVPGSADGALLEHAECGGELHVVAHCGRCAMSHTPDMPIQLTRPRELDGAKTQSASIT